MEVCSTSNIRWDNLITNMMENRKEDPMGYVYSILEDISLCNFILGDLFAILEFMLF